MNDTTFDEKLELEHHLDVAARWAIRLAFESWSEEAWEGSFPEVGEFDFDRIIESAARLAVDAALAGFRSQPKGDNK